MNYCRGLAGQPGALPHVSTHWAGWHRALQEQALQGFERCWGRLLLLLELSGKLLEVGGWVVLRQVPQQLPWPAAWP